MHFFNFFTIGSLLVIAPLIGQVHLNEPSTAEIQIEMEFAPKDLQPDDFKSNSNQKVEKTFEILNP